MTILSSRPARLAAAAFPIIAALYGASVGATTPPHGKTAVAPPAAATASEGARLSVAARAFLSGLTPSLRAKAVFPLDAEERLTWHYVPIARRGVALGEMDSRQRAAAGALLRAALSEAGYKKVETIRSLETVLREVENSLSRDPNNYYLTVFGDPSPGGVWAMRYEGHHLSFHWTIVGGRVVASTPQFLGANPARVGRRVSAQGPIEATRALPGEEDLARALVRTLTGAQQKKGILSDTAPGDILTAAGRRAEMPRGTDSRAGVTFAELDPRQRGLLIGLIREHSLVQTEAVAARRLDAIRKAGLDSIRFAWMGGREPGQGHYYRIQGKTFLIEYDNTQNRANHIHTVWRDLGSDFGEDALAEHYRRFPTGTPQGKDHGHDHPHP